MSEENKAIVRRWFDEVWNRGNANTLNELLSASATVHNLPVEQSEEKMQTENFLPMVEAFRGAFPDLHIEVEDMIAEGDKVTARCRVRGTHRGDSLGVAATNTPVEFTGITIARIKNGQIVEGWNNFDFLAMYQQLGVVADPNAKE
jgi:steroid delta-isomerase-like uncharacterized protein